MPPTSPPDAREADVAPPMVHMHYVAVDWSGAVRPAGTIWLAEASGRTLRRLEALDSREAAVQRVRDYCGDGVHRGGRRSAEPVLVGLDFSFSLPAWFCRHLGAASAVELWPEVARQGEAWLARCAWPFWGRPGRPRPDLPAHLRRTEARVAAVSRIAPKSTFQIGGAGSPGTGSLRGMPHLIDLRRSGCAVWPFDAPGQVTIVEMYPRVLTGAVVKSRPAARRAYLRAAPWRVSDAQRRAICGSEDAFDAAISALVMADSDAELASLPTTDELGRIEGEIWVPTRRDSGAEPLTGVRGGAS